MGRPALLRGSLWVIGRPLDTVGQRGPLAVALLTRSIGNMAKRNNAAKGGEAAQSATQFVPPEHSLTKLRIAAADCRGCDLWERATQTVFGVGAAPGTVILVGEQPGNEEDRIGKPFVGPAGKLLDKALEEAGIDRRKVYVTNAVKHFSWEPRGKLRIHKKPTAREVTACRPWLDAEIDAVHPKLVVCLGATAAQALLGRQFRVTRQRGTIITTPEGLVVLATIHPSAVLRAPDHEAREREMRGLVDDLNTVRQYLTSH